MYGFLSPGAAGQVIRRSQRLPGPTADVDADGLAGDRGRRPGAGLRFLAWCRDKAEAVAALRPPERAGVALGAVETAPRAALLF
ncbi:hypothetical protein GCM10010330_66890 [Streptomyces tendae]|nr:hypothetical protein GCM10010330_66890 [Streptomyces tendae]